MTHIAHCMRYEADRSSVYISPEPPVSKSPATNEPVRPLEKSPSLVSLQQQQQQQQQGLPSRYQLWPSAPSKSPASLTRPTFPSDKATGLSMGRSLTSLSDPTTTPETLPFWQRGSSLARRRKISVPELGGGSAMATVQETAIDSPTIPGRPPLRKASTEGFGHERSSSAPGTNWRTGPFGDAMVSCVTGPSYLNPDQAAIAVAASPALELPKPELTSLFGKPLSPILSPGNAKPALKVDTGASFAEALELPPEVPPKSPSMDRRGSPKPPLSSRPSRTQLMTPSSLSAGTPVSAVEMRRSPNTALPTPISAAFNSTTSPSSAVERRASPRVERTDPLNSHSRNASDTSIIDRGRPIRRSSKRQRSRTCSEANNPDSIVPDTWKLPKGIRPVDASVRLNEADKEHLHKQAFDQAEKFEVLTKKDVASMSRELRALDERCDYLRKTYKSLRAGRQKLHSRMISYLKRGETVIFSRESLLKQEEALAELDVSIDEFIHKLEQAENRRLRLRQKLLEHVAAALVLNPSGGFNLDMATSTPPRSPVKAESPVRQVERRDVESIKIYADGHVLSLFSDIEQAIGKMCEQTC